MTIEMCYQKIGGNLSEVLQRFPDVDFINKFIKMFLTDESFNNLCKAIENDNPKEAFRAAHTLKGISQNLGFGNLLLSSDRLTEILRTESEKIPENAISALNNLCVDYETTVSAIKMYLSEQGKL